MSSPGLLMQVDSNIRNIAAHYQKSYSSYIIEVGIRVVVKAVYC